MKKVFHSLFATIFLLFSQQLFACPFCDAGGTETALFVIVIFGTFAIAAFFIFLAFKKKGAFREDLKLEASVLKAENIISKQGIDNERI